MKRNIKLGKGFEQEGRQVASILSVFDREGEMIHNGRNTIKCFDTPRGKWNVKRYHKPNAINRVIYSFFRKPKGLRAFVYPEKVLAAGFETPCPVAYIEERTAGLLGYSYFISEQCPYRRRFYEFGNARLAGNEEVWTAFARYTAALHEAHIYHKDYSPGNILFDRLADGYHFSIVDINRMRFGTVTVKQGCRNFARLWGQPEMFIFLSEVYAEARHADPLQCRAWVMQARNAFWKPRAKNFKLPFELNF